MDDNKLHNILKQGLEDQDLDVNASKKRVWQRIESTIGAKEIELPRSNRGKWFQWISAAVVVGIMAISFFQGYESSNITINKASYAQRKHIALPDASKVELNSDSRITYDERTWSDGQRTVKLKGEAFFEVKKGSSFTVETSQGNVTVLGTSFNVYARKNIFEVVCKTGKVQVDHLDQKVVLTPNERAYVSEKILKKETIEDRSIAWLQNELEFRNTDISEVFAELERQYDVSINYKNVPNKSFTGRFNKGDLEDALKTVCWPMSLDYRIDKNKVTILEKTN